MTLYLPPHLEFALASEAARRGMTPDALAAELIIAQLPPAGQQLESIEENASTSTKTMQPTMHDRWKAHLESLPKPVPGACPTDYSQDTGRKFAEAMIEKRRQGRL